MDREMTDLHGLQARMEEMWQALHGRLEALEARGEVAKITAAVDSEHDRSIREEELLRKLNEALGAIEGLRANAEKAEAKPSARKTLPSATVQLLAKQGIDVADAVELPALDAALAGMSVEQRIAVKSQLMRTGALSL